MRCRQILYTQEDLEYIGYFVFMNAVPTKPKPILQTSVSEEYVLNTPVCLSVWLFLSGIQARRKQFESAQAKL